MSQRSENAGARHPSTWCTTTTHTQSVHSPFWPLCTAAYTHGAAANESSSLTAAVGRLERNEVTVAQSETNRTPSPRDGVGTAGRVGCCCGFSEHSSKVTKQTKRETTETASAACFHYPQQGQQISLATAESGVEGAKIQNSGTEFDTVRQQRASTNTEKAKHKMSFTVSNGATRLLLTVVVLLLPTASIQAQQEPGDRVYKPEMDDLYITVNARTRTLELAWRNFDDLSNYILLAEQYPVEAFEPRQYYYTTGSSGTTTDASDGGASSGTTPAMMMMMGDDDASIALSSPEVTTSGTTENSVSDSTTGEMELVWAYDFRDESGYRQKEVLFSLQPVYTNGWTKTGIKFNYDLLNSVNTNTSCYGYYAYFVRPNGTVQSAHCMKLHPRWMTDLRTHLSPFRMRELFIPGTHDSASYKDGFDPLHQETIITKYSLTQDEDVYGQLLHGIRYIDLRVGYYKNSRTPFWANHGISRLHPLINVLEQIKRYAQETNEIIVLDVQEFPVGFGKEYNIHTKLIEFLQSTLRDVMASPSIGWSGTLGDVWAGGKTVIVAYDLEFAFRSFPDVVWRSVQQRWGNVQKVNDLKDYLFKVHHPKGFREYSFRPVADMAELTPDPWGVITDRYGGLRKMADSVNRFVTKWYFEDLGPTANVVAVDFVRGTSIVEAAIYWNLKRVPNGPINLHR